MASRQEEKEKRRQERLEREQAEQGAAARRKRLQFVFGGLLSVLVVAAVVVLLVGGVFGGGSGGGGKGSPRTNVSSSAKIPGQQTTDLKKAVAAANCKLVNAPIEGNTHETKNFKASDYKTNPPTSGNHNPVWYPDGLYNPGDVPRLGMIVHPLEHGRIELQYKPGTPQSTVKQLETLYNEEDSGYHMLMFQNTTNMPFAVAAAAWGHYVGCPTMNDKVFDALRTFHDAYIDKGPEVVP
jgi:Protein of unknown function (DUF3105)